MDEGLNYLQTFNPIESKPELLEKTLIGRKELVDLLEKLVIESATSGNKHQRLIIGPRGSGKTHLLRVLYNRISNRSEVKDKLKIAYLCEDEYGIAAFLDFIIRILRAFIKWNPENSNYLIEEIEKLKKVPYYDQEKIAVNILKKHIEGTTLLVILENIWKIFAGIKDKGQGKFRDLVQQSPFFTIMASNQALFRDIQEEDKPFHNFFKITYLKKLTLDETILFLKSIAEWEEKDDLLKFLDEPEGKGRIHAIYDITGGNHRLLVTFYNFLKVDYKNSLSYSFIKTINDLIPYYQSFMNQLSAQQQKIVQYLCQIRKPSNVKDIAENCFSSQNTISKQMSTLEKLKYVDSRPSGKETFYELSEPLLRICFEVKENRGRPIKLFIDFLGNFYSTEETNSKRLKKNGALVVKEPSTEYGTKKENKNLAENLTFLFIHGSKENISNYLKEAIVLIRKYDYSEQFFQAIPQSIFEILIQHEEIEIKRFEFIENMLNETFKQNESMIVPLKFLNIGIRHLKKNEKNVLFQFTKEERNAFKKFVLDKIE
jgi:DNA-binding MarR family transcriptional regulator